MFKNRVYSLASIATIMACLTLLGAFYFVIRNMNFMLEEAETNVGVTVFFDEGIDEASIFSVEDQVKKRPEVAEVVYISAAEAWEKYKTESLSPELAATFGSDNPLEDSASIEVYLKDSAEQSALVAYIQRLPGVRKVNYSQKLADGFVSVKRIIWIVGIGLISILILVALFLIRTTITTGINVRREEISIMSIIGATDFFIQSPFVVEGILIGFLGSLFPIVILDVAYGKITETFVTQFSDVFNNISLIPKNEITRGFVPLAILMGVGIGFISSTLTVKRNVRRIFTENL